MTFFVWFLGVCQFRDMRSCDLKVSFALLGHSAVVSGIRRIIACTPRRRLGEEGCLGTG